MEFTTEDREGYCIVRVVGEHRRPDDSLVILRHTQEISEERGRRRWLIDLTGADTVGGTMGAYEAGTMPLDPKQRVALVFSGNLRDHKFMEDVAVNRGYQLRVFDDCDVALAWLLETADGG